jgi:hypothetical protein
MSALICCKSGDIFPDHAVAFFASVWAGERVVVVGKDFAAEQPARAAAAIRDTAIVERCVRSASLIVTLFLVAKSMP